MKVYVIGEEGSWDYELTHHVEAYASFEDAVNSYRNLVKNARLDMKEQIKNSDDIIESEQIDEEAETASFEIYKNGYYTQFHDTIEISNIQI